MTIADLSGRSRRQLLLQLAIARLVFRHGDPHEAPVARDGQHPRNLGLRDADHLGDLVLQNAVDVVEPRRQQQLGVAVDAVAGGDGAFGGDSVAVLLIAGYSEWLDEDETKWVAGRKAARNRPSIVDPANPTQYHVNQ